MITVSGDGGYPIARRFENGDFPVKDSTQINSDNLAALTRMIRDDRWLMSILEIVRETVSEQAYVGAGAIRDTVWDIMSGVDSHSVRDVDVVYFDVSDTSEEREQTIRAALENKSSDVLWDVTNQAGVHEWFHLKFGYRVDALESLEDAVATWPEYATCVAVRIDSSGALDIVAPYGLYDLMNKVVRRNPRRVSQAQYQRRIERKNGYSRWPGVEVVHMGEQLPNN